MVVLEVSKYKNVLHLMMIFPRGQRIDGWFLVLKGPTMAGQMGPILHLGLGTISTYSFRNNIYIQFLDQSLCTVLDICFTFCFRRNIYIQFQGKYLYICVTCFIKGSLQLPGVYYRFLF